MRKIFKSGRGLKLQNLFIVEHGRSKEVNSKEYIRSERKFESKTFEEKKINVEDVWME